MIQGVHVLAVSAIVLTALSVRATELYTTRYQSLPVQDWLESRQPFAQSVAVPAATDLARGLVRALPLLVIRSDAQTFLPMFAPPAFFQRTIGGVRDAARIELGSPGAYKPGEVPVRARLEVIVFNRVQSAAGWAELMAREMDIRDPEGAAQARTSGPDEADGVWVIAPRSGGGVATVAGHRATVGFALQVAYLRRDSDDPARLADLSSRAEVAARQAADDWSGWLVQQLRA